MTADKVDLPKPPPPARTTGTTVHQPVVSAQPKKVAPMSIESDAALRLRGGCGCIVGGVNIETGPCVCHTTGYGCLGCLACILIFIPNCLVGGVIGTLNCLLCGALHNCHCATADNAHNN